jgi:hypothetical protein
MRRPDQFLIIQGTDAPPDRIGHVARRRRCAAYKIIIATPEKLDFALRSDQTNIDYVERDQAAGDNWLVTPDYRCLARIAGSVPHYAT